MQVKTIKVGDIYRIRRRQIGGCSYQKNYDGGLFIHVRVLEVSKVSRRCKVTTRGRDGKHLGPGGGWEGESTLSLWIWDLEEIGD